MAKKRLQVGINDFLTYCKNNNLTKYLEEWDYEKNEISPAKIVYNSSIKVHWKCIECGYEWIAALNYRIAGHECRKCSYKELSETKKKVKLGEDLETQYPEIAKEWDYEKNKPFTPKDVKPASEKIKPWWICPNGHSYQASLTNRTNNGSGCPYCTGKKAFHGFNDLESKYPEIAKEWDTEKNKGLQPSDVTYGSKKKYWWLCRRGHSYCMTPNARTTGHYCPKCSDAIRTSLPEQAITFYLSKAFTVQSRKQIDGWEADVFLPDYNIAVEYDGIYFHSQADVKERELKKERVFAENGVYLIRVKEAENDTYVNDEHTISYNRTKQYKYLDEALENLVSLLSRIIGKNIVIDINFDKDRIEIMQQYRNYTKERNLTITNPELVTEWNYEKNGTLIPEYYTKGSAIKVWWKCNMGHEWEATIASRAAGHGCPFCNGIRPIPNETDLATLFPEISKQWDYEKNAGVTPIGIAPASHNKYWWKCEKGHSYSASPLNRTQGGLKCPYCSNKKVLTGFNDLRTNYPQIADEWAYEDNGELTPDAVVYGSNKIVTWICPNCKGKWQCRIIERVKGRTCPHCRKVK